MTMIGVSNAQNGLVLLSQNNARKPDKPLNEIEKIIARQEKNSSKDIMNRPISISELLAFVGDIDPNEAGAKILYRVRDELLRAEKNGTQYQVKDGLVEVAGASLVVNGYTGSFEAYQQSMKIVEAASKAAAERVRGYIMEENKKAHVEALNSFDGYVPSSFTL